MTISSAIDVADKTIALGIGIRDRTGTSRCSIVAIEILAGVFRSGILPGASVSPRVILGSVFVLIVASGVIPVFILFDSYWNLATFNICLNLATFNIWLSNVLLLRGICLGPISWEWLALLVSLSDIFGNSNCTLGIGRLLDSAFRDYLSRLLRLNLMALSYMTRLLGLLRLSIVMLSHTTSLTTIKLVGLVLLSLNSLSLVLLWLLGLVSLCTHRIFDSIVVGVVHVDGKVISRTKSRKFTDSVQLILFNWF